MGNVTLLTNIHNCCCEAVGCDAVRYAQIKKKEVVKFTQVRPVGKTRTGKATTKEGKGKEKMIEQLVTVHGKDSQHWLHGQSLSPL